MPPKQEPEKPQSNRRRGAKGRTRQIDIIHLSDMHFGSKHRFDPEVAPGGDRLSAKGIVTLADKVLEDLVTPLNGVPGALSAPEASPEWGGTILCLTGDFAETGAYAEFSSAELFVRQATKYPGIGGMERVFIVPGNHDVPYDKADVGERWQQYINFHNRLYGESIPADNPWQLDRVYDRSDDLGVIVACINSCIYVRKGTPDEQRGQIDEAQLNALEAQLKRIKKSDMRSSIKVALIHHHPVLIPSLAESYRGYDAVMRSGQLLNLLGDYGFHVLLHGHKHHPHTFTEDIQNAFEEVDEIPMVIGSGGSVGSTGLPDGGVNSYNRITVKWHPEAEQVRVRTITRGLVIQKPDTKRRMSTKNWYWTTLAEADKSYTRRGQIVKPKAGAHTVRSFDENEMAAQEKKRVAEYALTRRNFPVVEVRPSLHAGQAYEATVWLVPHKPNERGWEMPKKVVWSAGNSFDVVEVTADNDPRFCATFDYWGPMVIQAEIWFSNGKSYTTHIYARIPGG